MDGQSSIVRFNDGIRYFRGGNDGEGFHNSIRIFFSNLGDQKSTHTRSCTTTQRVGDLESLEAVASFSFFSDHIEYWVNKLGTFGIMTFGPVVSGSGLAKDEVIRSEKLTERSSSNGIHGSWFQIHKDCSWNITTTSGFVVVDVDSFQLKIRISVVGTSWVDSVFIRNNFPKFGTDLITALSSLNMNYFSHLKFKLLIFELIVQILVR